MKKILTIIALLSVVALNVQAQDESWDKPLTQTYIGFGTGINSFTGAIGAAGNVRIGRLMFMEGSIGLGTWGYKYSIGLRYDFRLKNTFGAGINYTGATGMDGLVLPMTLRNGTSKNVSLNCHQAATVDIKGRYSMNIGRSNILYFDLGYAIPLEEKAWEITDGSDVSSSDMRALDVIQPGGFLAGIGVLFGI